MNAAQERIAAATFFRRFDSCSPAQQIVLTRNRRQYGRCVVEGLLDRARSAAHQDAADCRRFADLALLALDRGVLEIADRKALEISVRIEVANALRIQGDLRGAARSWQEIDGLGTDYLDPMEQATVLSLRASFELWRRNSNEAVCLLRHVANLVREHGGRLDLALILTKMCPALTIAGQEEEALQVAHDACRLLEPGDDGRLRLAAVHNLAYAADMIGETELAEIALHGGRQLYREHGGDLVCLRRDWMLARCRIARHDLDQAETILERVSAEFAQRRMLYEFALVGLDQMRIWAEQERWTRLQQHAAALVDAFTALGVAPEAMAAFIELQHAQQRQTTVR